MSGGPPSSTLQVLACQLRVPPTVTAKDRDAHLRDTVAQVRRQLSTQKVDLVALPELSSMDYSQESLENLDELSEPLDGPSFAAWREVAREFNVHVEFGFPRRAEDGFYISLAVVAPSGGLVGYYDKIHLAQYGASMEKEYFRPGKHLFAFDVAGFRIAPIICYDIRIPELSRTLVLDHGVDLILHAGAYFRDESFYSWHHFAISRALENQIYLLSLNRAGRHFGQSVFCLPWVDERHPPIVFPDRDESFLKVSLDRAAIERARERYPFLKDRLGSYDLPIVGTSGASASGTAELERRTGTQSVP